MNHTPPPTIRVIDQGMNVRFPPQKHWGFVSAERFELRLDTELSMSELRHAHARLTDVSLSISMKDLEWLVQSRLERSDFKEIHFLGAEAKTSGQPSPLMCWGIYQPQGQRAQTFYLEGGFHALAHSLRFEFYQGLLFGLGELNAQTLAARLLKEAGLPAQRTHPTVLNIDPLTELSLAYCLDWGWKLPQRKLDSEIDISAKEISFISGRTRDAYLQSSFDPTANKITPQQRVHLDYLRKFHEGEGLIHAEEFESAKIFFKSHIDDPRAAARFIDLSRWLGEANEHLNEWLKEDRLSPAEKCRIEALLAENNHHYELASQKWSQYFELELEGFRKASVSKPSARSPLSLNLLDGLKEFTLGLLLTEVNSHQSLHHLEIARTKLGFSCQLLNTIAHSASLADDLILAQARLTEAAQYLASNKQANAAALTWVKVGELWMHHSESFDHAERAFRRALEIDPTALDPYFKLAQLNEARGDFIAAKALLERVLELSPYSKLARDTLNRIALELEQPLQAQVTKHTAKKVAEVTRIPQETDDRLSPIQSAAPLPLDHQALDEQKQANPQQPMNTQSNPASAREDLPTPPPKPLSAGPFTQQDPWSLAPQEKLESWLKQSTEQNFSEPTAEFQSLSPVSNHIREGLESSEKITSTPQAFKSNERTTEKPKRQEQPTLEPVPITKQVDDSWKREQITKQNRSEKITQPPKAQLDSHGTHRKLPTPPRANQAPIAWHTGDFDAINTALSLAHPAQDSEQELPVIEAPVYTEKKIEADKDISAQQKAEKETKSPAPFEQVKEVPTDLSEPFSPELRKKQEAMEAALDGLLSHDEAEKEISRLADMIPKVREPQKQAEVSLEIAVIYRDQLLDLANAKMWLWDGLHYSSNEDIQHELKESLAELYMITEDWNGLLDYYHFIAEQAGGDPAEAYLQRASLLKTLERHDEALVDCEHSLNLLAQENRKKQSARRQDRYEEVIRLKADLLSSQGDDEDAVTELLRDHELLDLTRVALRKAYAARLVRDHNPQQANTLFQEAYQVNQSESLLEEWRGFTQQWGDPYAKASVIRAMIEGEEDTHLSGENHARISARRLVQLADEIAIDEPLLALDLYQESLDLQSDLDVVEKLMVIAEKEDQYQSLLNGLDQMIPQCFEGEYRGILKLKRAFVYYIIHDERAAEEAQEALVDFEGKIESVEEFEALLAWAETRCMTQDYHQVLTWLDSVGIFDH